MIKCNILFVNFAYNGYAALALFNYMIVFLNLSTLFPLLEHGSEVI